MSSLAVAASKLIADTLTAEAIEGLTVQRTYDPKLDPQSITNPTAIISPAAWYADRMTRAKHTAKDLVVQIALAQRITPGDLDQADQHMALVEQVIDVVENADYQSVPPFHLRGVEADPLLDYQLLNRESTLLSVLFTTLTSF